MAPVVPFIPAIIGGASSMIGGLLGGKKGKSGQIGNIDTKPLQNFGGALLPMAKQNIQQSSDYYGNLLSNPQALSEQTASDAASTGRQSQQAVDSIKRNSPRGGFQAQALSQIPQQVRSEGLMRRLSAKSDAAGKLGQLGLGAGQIGEGAFSTLLGNQTNQGYLDLARTRENRDYYGKIGGSIFDILTGSNPIGKDSPLGKLGGLFGKKGPTGLPQGTNGDWGGETSFLPNKTGPSSPFIMY